MTKTKQLKSFSESTPDQQEVEENLLVVQFLHPGGEYSKSCFLGDAGNPIKKQWSTACAKGHHRSFLQCEGTYQAGNGKSANGLLNFWGEWEGPAAVEILPVTPEGPRWLLTPRFPDKKDFGMNTDPFVFDGPFRYSFCQQSSKPTLRNLGVGSMLLFGSCWRKKFLLDTVFVVGRNCGSLNSFTKRKDLGLFGQMNITPILKEIGESPCTGKTKCGDDPQASVYEGATPEAPVNGIYSFVPARPATSKDSVFSRPVLESDVLEGFITPGLSQGIKRTAASTATIVEAWKRLTKELRKQGFVFGVQFEIDPKSQSSKK